MGTEGIDKVRNEIFLGGALADGLFLVFDDDFRIGDFDDFSAGDSELGINKAFNHGAFDDDLLNHKIIISDSEANDATEVSAFFRFDSEADEVKVQAEDVFNPDDVIITDKFLGAVDDDSEAGIFANTLSGKKAGFGTGRDDAEGKDLKSVWINDGLSQGSDTSAILDAKDWSAG